MDIFRKFKLLLTRRNLANCLMFLFVAGVSIGAGMFALPAGFVACGICCGIFGYLLGSE